MCTKSGKDVGVTGVVTCDNFFRDQLSGVNTVEGQSLPFPYCIARDIRLDLQDLKGFK